MPNVVALFSKPGPRRRIPDPVEDSPVVLCTLREGKFYTHYQEEEDLSLRLRQYIEEGAIDMTPHMGAGEKMTLHLLSQGKTTNELLETSIPRAKRRLIHLESLGSAPGRGAGGVEITPALYWGVLKGRKYPGEAILSQALSDAYDHLELGVRLAKAAGVEEVMGGFPPIESYGSQVQHAAVKDPEDGGGETKGSKSKNTKKKTPDTKSKGGKSTPSSLKTNLADEILRNPEKTAKGELPNTLEPLDSLEDTKVDAGEGLSIPAPGVGVGYFSWIRRVITNVPADGPVGRGWGRTSEEKRKTYFIDGGRLDPGYMEISGFVYVTTEGHTVFQGDEGEVIRRGMRLLEVARYSCGLVVEDVRAFKNFTLLRAAEAGVVLPSWIFFPTGRAWFEGLERFVPPMEEDPVKWLMRIGVATGERACTRFIPEPGEGLCGGGTSPVIAAKAYLTALLLSPYGNLSADKSPDLWRG